MGNHAHKVRLSYKFQVHTLFGEYLEKIRALSGGYRINNLIVNLRNDIEHLIDNIYQELSVELEHNISIKPSRQPTFIPARAVGKGQCAICGERRVVNQCHIIPREKGGSRAGNNMLDLCPTHHFLFDQVRLSEEEFNKLDVTGKAADSVQYFEQIHKKQHQMYWRYGTNKSGGCNCGSLEFAYGATRNGNYAQPCLVCKNCGALWYLGAGHPLLKELSIKLYDITTEKIDEREEQKRLDAAMEKITKTLAERFIE